MQQLSKHPTHLILGVALAMAALAPRPAAATDVQCQNVDPPTTMCAGQDPERCVFKYGECTITYSEEHERTALLLENRGAEVGLFDEGDRRCFQSEFGTFDPQADLPDELDYVYHRFVLLLPEGWSSGPFPVFLDLRGGAPGWVKHGQAIVNSWALDFENEQPEWLKGVYKGSLTHAQSAFNEQNWMLAKVLAEDNFREGLRAKDNGAYGIILTSACSDDLHNGFQGLVQRDAQFEEASRNRFGLQANVDALAWVDAQYGVTHFYTGVTSGGGAGSFILARDLQELLPELAAPEIYRGALMDSAAFEPNEKAQVVDEVDDDNPLTDDLRHVYLAKNCTGQRASIPCDASNEPASTANVEAGLRDQSASERIRPDAGEARVRVPILYIWDTRDRNICSDACFSEEFLHGKIRDAIDARKEDGTPEEFDFSETLEVCIGSCSAPDPDHPGVFVPVNCVQHGVIGNSGVAACALDWIDAVNVYWDSGEVDPYVTPTSCVSSITANLSTNPPLCTEAPEIEFD